MAVLNIRRPSTRIVIPTDSNNYVRINITDGDGVVYNLMDTYSDPTNIKNHTINASITKTASDKLGNFRIKLVNDNGRFLNKFVGGEYINFYADETGATTLIFTGRVDDVKYGLNMSDGFHIVLDGREFPVLNDKTITGIESAATADVSIAGILNDFYSGTILKFWNGSSWSTATYDGDDDTVTWSPVAPDFPDTLINISYENKKGWGVIREICKRAGLDAYLEYDETNSVWTLKLALEEDIINPDCNVAYGVNLVNMSEFGTKNADIYNRIIVYGKTDSDNILLLKTEENTTSQDTLWIKDRIYNESDLTTMTEVQSKADAELAQNVSVPDSGRITTVFMPSIRPGEQIHVSIPYCTVNGYYRVQSYTHNFGSNFTTNFDLEKSDNKLSELFLQKLNPDDFTKPISNINAMKDSYTVYFNESPSVMALTNCEETGGLLRLSSGQTTGTATAATITADYDVTYCEFRKYDNYATDSDVYQVSNNGGITWETYNMSSGNIHTFNNPGKLLTFRITLNRTNSTDPSPAYESVCLLYRN
jgi:hypothetical protein